MQKGLWKFSLYKVIILSNIKVMVKCIFSRNSFKLVDTMRMTKIHLIQLNWIMLIL